MSNHGGRSITPLSDDLGPVMWRWASQAGEVEKPLPYFPPCLITIIIHTEPTEGAAGRKASVAASGLRPLTACSLVKLMSKHVLE